jgi:hypothetical protein
LVAVTEVGKCAVDTWSLIVVQVWAPPTFFNFDPDVSSTFSSRYMEH